MKACVLIPTYNEAKSIALLIKQIRSYNLEVIVVDDGSLDNTGSIAENSGATVLQNNKNEGKGSSLIKGFNYALRRGFEAVVTMDGDGQHLPQDIPLFIEAAGKSSSAVFVGNRMASPKNMPFFRRITNRFMSWFLSRVIKQKIYDTQCGFRLLKREVVEKLSLTTRKYETESEILIKASRLGFRIDSIPVATVYLDEKSKINPVVDALRFIRFIIKELWITRN